MHRVVAIAVTCLLASCAREEPKTGNSVDTIIVEDHFMECVDPHLEKTLVGSDHCPQGFRDGGICALPDKTRVFVEDTQEAVDSCLKHGGQVE